MLYGLYAYSKDDNQTQAHSYGSLETTGTVGYGFNDDPNNTNKMLQTMLSGETQLDFLNIKIEYGLSYSSNISE